jgi:hypothetical protein
MSEVVVGYLALVNTTTGYVQTIQAGLHSFGIDWIVWPIFLIVAWWVLLSRTNPLLKLFSLPVITIASYFVLYISYKTIISAV